MSDEHESLIQFLYLAPVGLGQCASDGLVLMMNPKAAQILMPLSPVPSLDNLFDVLGGVAPQPRAQVMAFDKPYGIVCDSLRFAVASVVLQSCGNVFRYGLSNGLLRTIAEKECASCPSN